jgi:WD40 repeat protein
MMPSPSLGKPSSADDPALFDLAEEMAARLQSGDSADVGAWIAAQGEHAERLRRLLPTVQAMAELGSAADGSAPPAGLEGEPVPGVLGDFRIVREVGRGGMGIVYEAEQLSLGRRVALKVLPFAATFDPRHLQRFKHEAQAAGHLSHPHIVSVYAVGSERGVHFYAMQFIDGQTLAALIESARRQAAPAPRAPAGAPTPPRAALSTEAAAPLSARAAAELGVQAAEALDYAHEQGVVHRDVKPGNLLVDARGKLWVTDFGLARFQTDAGLTLTGDLVGTLRYMSPEQALGRHAIVDARTDVYGLGVTLYELLTLRPAFDGRDRQVLLRQIAADDPPAPRALTRAVPVELETIVLKAMAKEPAARYASAGELADDLRRFLEHRPIRARRPTLADRAAKWARRHQLLVTAAAVFLVLAVLGLAAALVLLAGEQAQTARARDQALDRERALRQVLYAQDMGLTQQAFQDGDLERLRALLDRHRPEAGQDDLRGFEWFYQQLRCRGCPRPTAAGRGHQGDVYCVTYAPDGQTLASGGKDGVIRVWDAATLQPRLELPSGQGEVNEVAFAPDGRTLASAGDDGTVCLWDLPAGRWRAVLHRGPASDGTQPPSEGQAEMSALAFAPDGKTLAGGGTAGWVWLWDAETGALKAARDLHAGSIHYLAYAPDGQTLACANTSGRVPLLATADLEERMAFHNPFGPVESVAFSRDGKTLAAGSRWGGHIVLWDLAAAAVRAVLPNRDGPILSLAFSPDDSLLASGNKDGQVLLWDAHSSTLATFIEGNHDQVWCVSFAPDGKRLAAARENGAVLVYNVGPRRDHRRLAPPGKGTEVGPVDWVAFSPNDRELFGHVKDGSLGRWEVSSGRAMAPCQPSRSAQPPAVAAGGRIVTVDPGYASLRVSGRSGDEQAARPPRGSLVTRVAISPDGKRVAFVSDSDRAPHSVWTWAVGSGQPRELARGFDISPYLAFAPDGRTVAAADSDRVLLLDPEGGRPPRSLEGHQRYLGALAFSPDGRLLATAGRDPAVCLWDAATGRERNCLWQHRNDIQALTFTPDSRTLATGGSEVILWNVAHGQKLMVLEGNAGVVWALAFGPDGRTLASGGMGRDGKRGEINVWYGDDHHD